MRRILGLSLILVLLLACGVTTPSHLYTVEILGIDGGTLEGPENQEWEQEGKYQILVMPELGVKIEIEDESSTRTFSSADVITADGGILISVDGSFSVTVVSE